MIDNLQILFNTLWKNLSEHSIRKCSIYTFKQTSKLTKTINIQFNMGNAIKKLFKINVYKILNSDINGHFKKLQ